MALPITERDIQKYYNKIKELGQNPTIELIIQAHGGGSKSTVGPILKRLKAQDARPDSTAGVPNSVFNPLKAIFEKMEQEKSEWERQKTVAFEKAIQEQVQLTDEQIQLRKNAEKKLQEREIEIESLKSQLAQKDKMLGETQAERNTLRDQVNEQKETIQHQQSNIQELHSEASAIRRDYQQQVSALKAERTQALDEQRIMLTNTQIENENLKTLINELNLKKVKLDNQLTNLKTKLDDTAKIKAEMNECVEKLNSAKDDYHKAREQNIALEQQCSGYSKTILELKSLAQKAEHERDEAKLLNAKLDTELLSREKTIKELKDKI